MHRQRSIQRARHCLHGTACFDPSRQQWRWVSPTGWPHAHAVPGARPPGRHHTSTRDEHSRPVAHARGTRCVVPVACRHHPPRPPRRQRHDDYTRTRLWGGGYPRQKPLRREKQHYGKVNEVDRCLTYTLGRRRQWSSPTEGFWEMARRRSCRGEIPDARDFHCASLPSDKRWGRNMWHSWRWVFLFFDKEHGWGRDMGYSRRCSKIIGGLGLLNGTSS